MTLNVIMMGPPGAGKGTQAGRFSRERGLLKVSTGDILRDEIRSQSPVGRRAAARMDRGELVDDDAVVAIVRERLLRPDANRGFVLDGFPRTVSQAEALDVMVAERNDGPLVVVDVRVPEAELIRRLGVRLICGSCGAPVAPPQMPRQASATCAACGGELVQRVDDHEQVVRERLRVYERTTRPLVAYYRDRPTFRVVNGAQSPERVAHDLDAAIDAASLMPVAAPGEVSGAAGLRPEPKAART